VPPNWLGRFGLNKVYLGCKNKYCHNPLRFSPDVPFWLVIKLHDQKNEHLEKVVLSLRSKIRDIPHLKRRAGRIVFLLEREHGVIIPADPRSQLPRKFFQKDVHLLRSFTQALDHGSVSEGRVSAELCQFVSIRQHFVKKFLLRFVVPVVYFESGFAGKVFVTVDI